MPEETLTESTGTEPEVDYSNVTNDLFNEAKPAPTTVEEKKTEEVEKPETKLEPAKLDIAGKIKDANKAPELLEEPEPKDDKKDKRSYEGFDPEHAAMLKKLPNKEFNTLSKFIKDNVYPMRDELKKLKEEAQISAVEKEYSNPDGYKLSSEYTGLSHAVENLGVEVDYWRNALQRAQAGQPIKQLTVNGALNTDAEYGVGELIPKEQAQALAIENLTRATQKLDQVKGMREQYQQRYVGENQRLMQMSKQAASQYFPGLDNPADDVKTELESIRAQIGPFAKGFGGEMQTRTLYTLMKAIDMNKKLQAEVETYKKREGTMKMANPLLGASDRKKGNDVDVEDIYAGITNDMFRA